MLTNTIQQGCPHCNNNYSWANINKHVKACRQNPDNIKSCPVCTKSFVPKWGSITCSYSCANTLFRTGESNGNWKESYYRTTCFLHHKKECVVCGETLIVEVHHLDEDKTNNKPENLIPLCPTHHQYWHSKHKHLVTRVIKEYLLNWSRSRDLNSGLQFPKLSD